MVTGLVRRGQYRTVRRAPVSRIQSTGTPTGAPSGPGDIQDQANFEAQAQPYFPAASNRFSPDMDSSRAYREATHFADGPPAPDEAALVAPYGVFLSAKILQMQNNKRLRILLQQNPRRKRFMLINPNAAEILFFTFKNNGALIPLFPQSIWDESGSSISLDDIWINCTAGPASVFAYEGV